MKLLEKILISSKKQVSLKEETARVAVISEKRFGMREAVHYAHD